MRLLVALVAASLPLVQCATCDCSSDCTTFAQQDEFPTRCLTFVEMGCREHCLIAPRKAERGRPAIKQSSTQLMRRRRRKLTTTSSCSCAAIGRRLETVETVVGDTGVMEWLGRRLFGAPARGATCVCSPPPPMPPAPPPHPPPTVVLNIKLWGGAGHGSADAAICGGAGGFVTAQIAVPPGTTLGVIVGGGGRAVNAQGGNHGGTQSSRPIDPYSSSTTSDTSISGGGGMSALMLGTAFYTDMRELVDSTTAFDNVTSVAAQMLVVAGGGGGSGLWFRGGSGGAELAEEGSLGTICGDTPYTPSTNSNGGGAGSQTAGGDSYTSSVGNLVDADQLYQRRAGGQLLKGGEGMEGGNGWSGGTCSMAGAGGWPNGGGGFHGCGNGGGGGGGYYGGGGGSNGGNLGNSGGGGGGSSYPMANLTNARPEVASVVHASFASSGSSPPGVSDPDYAAALIGTFPSFSPAPEVARGGDGSTGIGRDGGPGLVVIEVAGGGAKTVFEYSGSVQSYTVA